MKPGFQPDSVAPWSVPWFSSFSWSHDDGGSEVKEPAHWTQVVRNLSLDSSASGPECFAGGTPLTARSPPQAVLYEGERTVQGFAGFLERQVKARPEEEDEVSRAALPRTLLSPTQPRTQRTREVGAKSPIILRPLEIVEGEQPFGLGD